MEHGKGGNQNTKKVGKKIPESDECVFGIDISSGATSLISFDKSFKQQGKWVIKDMFTCNS